MEGKATSEAAFPGEPVGFVVSPRSRCADEDVAWSGGGSPATGTGRRFTTTFPTGGTFHVSAACGGDSIGFGVTVCPIDEWLAKARNLFGPSIDFSRVRITTSRAVLGSAGSAWTCNTVIRFKRPRRPSDLPREATLIHELAHVWEHQRGQAQLLSGFLEQVGRLFGRDPYDFGGPAGVRNARSLTQFSKEGQAQIVTEWWRSANEAPADRKGIPFDTAGYLDDLRRLVASAQIGVAADHRTTLASSLDGIVARLVNALLGYRLTPFADRPGTQ